MRYELAILTHGRSTTLAATLRSFREQVRPHPVGVRVFADGVGDLARVVGTVRGVFPDVEDPAISATHEDRRNGFCRATSRLWQAAADGDADYVFWLEHDFVFERRVSLAQMASLLEQDGTLAQVALVRQACNAEEIAAGGVVEARPAAFAPRRSTVVADGVSWVVSWLDHAAFFTTNPSLMRRGFMEAEPFLYDGRPYCEGRYGIGLVERGYRFAYWGDGIPYVRHVGVRDGGGY